LRAKVCVDIRQSPALARCREYQHAIWEHNSYINYLAVGAPAATSSRRLNSRYWASPFWPPELLPVGKKSSACQPTSIGLQVLAELMQFRRPTFRSTKLRVAAIWRPQSCWRKRIAELAKKVSRYNDRV